MFENKLPAHKKDTVRFTLALSVPEYERLEHHSKRLAFDFSEIVRRATHVHLNDLDEQEEIYNKRKAERQKNKRGVASMPTHPGGFEPSGLGLDRPSPFASFITKREEEQTASSVDTRSDVAKADQAKRIRKSFDSYAEYVESAEDTLEQDIRRQKIVDDLKMRSLSDALGIEFLELLEKRSMRNPSMSNVVTLESHVPVAGDIDL